ncbi:eukaryotic cytochrome b561-domain-containing protein [Terfezia claveryi]|nr:eukaryotic cytochrome b561-domain-containing protein [Terfezia claveryi]
MQLARHRHVQETTSPALNRVPTRESQRGEVHISPSHDSSFNYSRMSGTNPPGTGLREHEPREHEPREHEPREHEPREHEPREHEPLLGRQEDVVIGEDHSLAYNWIQGTAPLAQVGGLVLICMVWASVLTHKMIGFDGHPMLNSLGVLLVIEAILVLQPTGFYNMMQKKRAAYVHASLSALAAASFASALVIVIWHKQHFHIPHFESMHSKFGAATYALIVAQALVGFTQLFIPQIYGSEENAKKMYKYHRFFGYAVILPMLLVTIILATGTYYGASVLHLKTWAAVLAGIAIVAGIYPRVKISKLRGDRGANAADGADAPEEVTA